jgi:hypothetical protein
VLERFAMVFADPDDPVRAAHLLGASDGPRDRDRDVATGAGYSLDEALTGAQLARS